MIELKQITKTFDNLCAVDHISATISDGMIFGLVGSNGAGKSTLLRMISGIYKPDEGEITLDGAPIFENPECKKQICFLSDSVNFFPNATPEIMCRYYQLNYPNFDETYFYKLIEKFLIPKDRKLQKFSKGQKKQVSLLLGLCTGTRYLLCDETFDGLDPVMRQTVKSLFASELLKREFTPIISSHNLRELEDICDTVGLIHNGKLLFTRDLDSMKCNINKIQCVLPSHILEEELLSQLSILQYEKSGSLLTITARGSRDEILNITMAKDPIFAEIFLYPWRKSLSVKRRWLVMTSKTSYNNSISSKRFVLENIRQRGWLFAVSTLLIFLLQTVYATLNIDNYLTLSGTEFIQSYQTSFPELLNGANNRFFGFLIIAIAIASGVTGFAYLHKPKSVDFFHGFPLRREQWFRISYISGLLLFLVPYLIASICTMIIGSIKGVLVSANLLPSIFAVISGILCFMIIYHTTILAMMLTGKLVVGTLAALVLIVYGSMVQGLFSGLISTFLNTQYSSSPATISSSGMYFQLENLGSLLSPMELCNRLLYGNMIQMENEHFFFSPGKSIVTFGICILFLILTWFLARMLYQKRPLEVAGNALAYPKMASLLKFLIVVPTALFVGLYSDSFYYRSDNTWIILISILAAILLCAVVEFIYTQDLAQIFKRRVASLLSIGSVILILSLLHFDVFGFDSWLPEKEDVKSMALFSSTYSDYFSYPLSQDPEMQSAYNIALSYTLYSDSSQVTDFAPIYALAEEGVENEKNGITSELILEEGYDDYTSIVIRFNQKSNTSKFRYYIVKREHLLSCLEELCKEESYRKDLFPIFHIGENEVKHIAYSNFVDEEELILTKEQIQNLSQAYEEDLLETPIATLQEEEPLGRFTFYWSDTPLVKETVSSGMDYLSNLFFYSTFERTLGLLEEYGYTVGQQISPNRISQMIHVTFTETPEDRWNTTVTQQDYKSELRIPVTDFNEMETLLERICYSPNGILGSKPISEDFLEIWFQEDTSVTHFNLKPKQ